MKVSELLTDESKWTKEAYARNSSGDVINMSDPLATSFCLMCALRKCYGFNHTIYNTIWTSIGNIQTWNDKPERTFQDVRELILKLDL